VGELKRTENCPFHGGNTGSIPVGRANRTKGLARNLSGSSSTFLRRSHTDGVIYDWLSVARTLRVLRDPGCATRSSEVATWRSRRRRLQRRRLRPQSVSRSNSLRPDRASRKRIGSGTPAAGLRRPTSTRRPDQIRGAAVELRRRTRLEKLDGRQPMLRFSSLAPFQGYWLPVPAGALRRQPRRQTH
jgi:hypothetical protein